MKSRIFRPKKRKIRLETRSGLSSDRIWLWNGLREKSGGAWVRGYSGIDGRRPFHRRRQRRMGPFQTVQAAVDRLQNIGRRIIVQAVRGDQHPARGQCFELSGNRRVRAFVHGRFAKGGMAVDPAANIPVVHTHQLRFAEFQQLRQGRIRMDPHMDHRLDRPVAERHGILHLATSAIPGPDRRHPGPIPWRP